MKHTFLFATTTLIIVVVTVLLLTELVSVLSHFFQIVHQ